MEKTLKGRSETGDRLVNIVDVRQGSIGELIYNGTDELTELVSFTDSTVSGATAFMFISIGEASADYAFDIECFYERGKIGQTVSVTVTKSTDNVATFTELIGLDDNQIDYMTSIKITFTTKPEQGNHKVFFLKKAVLG